MYELEFDHFSLWKNNSEFLKVYGSNDGTDHWKVDLDVVKIVCLTNRFEWSLLYHFYKKPVKTISFFSLLK